MKYIMVITILVLGQSSFATDISGDVSGVWTSDQNPYVVVGDIRVPPGQSLEILPGCYIEFAGYYRFIVDSLALFTAIGTESDSIIFTAQNRNTGWNGLRFYYPNSTALISYCRFERGRGADHNQFEDYTRAWGGAIYIIGGDLQVDNSHFIDNRAWEGFGGAIYALQANLSVTQSNLEYNLAGRGGAAIYADSAIVNISGNIVFMDSSWNDLGGERGGGAIGIWYSNSNIENNLFSDNFCGLSGGGLFVVYGIAIVNNNTFTNNGAYYYGGGLGVGTGKIAVINNLIVNNYIVRANQTSGGGIACGDSVSLRNNTIVNNYCPVAGGGVRWANRVLTDTIENNIIWGNVSYYDSQMVIDYQQPIVIYNNIQGGWAGEGNINIDPLFIGPDDFHLSWLSYPWPDSTKSPCIDAGDPSSPPDSDGTRADMGAYPFDPNYQDIIDDIIQQPRSFALLQNYPNPFNAQTTISYSLSESGPATLTIYNLLGQKAATLFDGVQTAGEHRAVWDAQNQPSGVYFCRLHGENFTKSSQMVLLR